MSVSSITKSINDALRSLPAPNSITTEEKAALFAACDKLKSSFEGPLEYMTKYMVGTHQHTTLLLGIEMGIFDTMVTKPEGMDTVSLASAVKADPKLVVRIMRALARMGFFEEVGEDKYTATPVAGGFVSVSPLAHGIIHFGLVAESLVKTPRFFAEIGYQNPTDTYAGPFQYAFNTELQFFEWIKNDPHQQMAFNSVMNVSRANHGEDWFNFYPVEKKFKIQDAKAPLLVDVGGGLGHDITAFQAKYPNIPGRLILQDLQSSIDDITKLGRELGAGIETMAYDFFTPQPVKNARAYYMRNILHDWPDKQAREILGRIREAMGKDSLLLINENALPKTNVPLWSADLDLTMMALFASEDRTEKQFGELLDSAGFKLLKVWTPEVVPGALASGFLFEAVKK